MILTEKINYENPLISLKVFSVKRILNQYNDWHIHKETEVLAILEGQLEVNVENEEYILNKGDVILIGSNQLHRDRCRDVRLRYIVLQFDLEQFFDQSIMQFYNLFEEAGNRLSQFNYIFSKHPDVRDEVFHCVKTVHEESKDKKRGYEIAVTVCVQKIILAMLRNDERGLLRDRINPEFERIKPVLDYVEQHLHEKLQVEHACKLANMSYYYFCKFFKRAVGMSFTDYVNYKKIKKAEHLLLTKDYSVSTIGEMISMPNMAHFYKCFRKYNDCSPNEFRKKMLSWSP
ncbi:helix-turn-helix domain-containing protein [Marinicrinis sediminis]|uniref:Helix-turn-helix domain-containing protein n=1 Tax=Marinicrinis sediminis TaxID=1652465 RepID=A0ABW5R9B1_9BACL